MEHRVDRSYRSPSPVAGSEQTPTEQPASAASGQLGGMTVQPTSSATSSLSTSIGQHLLGNSEPPTAPVLDRTPIVPVGEPSTSTQVAQPSTTKIRKRSSPAESTTSQRMTSSAASQAGCSRIQLQRVDDDDPLSKYMRSNIGQAKLIPAHEIEQSAFDRFIIGGPFPNLSENDIAELRLETKAFEIHTKPIINAPFGKYRLLACPFVPIGSKNLVHLVHADDLNAYSKISQLWVQMRQATAEGDRANAIMARDQLTAYINDPRGLKKSALEAFHFQSEVTANFVESGVFEHILDAGLDYFAQAFAVTKAKTNAETDAHKYQQHRIIFTLLFMQDRLRTFMSHLARMDSPPDMEWNDTNNPILFFQAHNKRLTIQGKNPHETSVIVGILLQIVSHLLIRDCDRAKTCQPALLHYQNAFNFREMMTVLENI